MGVPGAFSSSTLLGVILTLLAFLTPAVPRWKVGRSLKGSPGAPAPPGPGDACPLCLEPVYDEGVTLIQLLQGNSTGRICLKDAQQLRPSGLFRELLVRAALTPGWWLESLVLFAWAWTAVWAYGYCERARPARGGRRLDIGAAIPAGTEADRAISR